MARILALETCTPSMKSHLLKSLRTLDEAARAVVLPCASRSETSVYKSCL